MALEDLKLKHTLSTLGRFVGDKNASNQSGGSLPHEKNASNQSGGTISEGKKHDTPKFIQHCVTAITEKPEELRRIQRKKDGSPFGICTAVYKRNKRELAAKHSRGQHHTVKDYEKALKKLRTESDALRASRPGRDQIVFEALDEEPKRPARSDIRFKPL